MADPGAVAKAPAASQPAPFFDARSHLVEYAGPGRDEAAPEGLNEVKIGWFGPSEPAHPAAGGMWCAALLAVDEANQSGGCGGIPFHLVGSWSENPWGTGIKGVTRLVYDERVWAIVGGPDGPSAHLVEQVVTKARLAFVNPVSTDKTANLVNVPWIFSCAPGDHLQAPPLARAVVSQRGLQPQPKNAGESPGPRRPLVKQTRNSTCAAQAGDRGFVLVSCTDHDSRLTTTELIAALNRLRAFPKRHLEFQPGSAGFARQVQGIREAGSGAVVLIAGPVDSARFVTALRRAGLNLPVLGGPAMGRRIFIEQAGEFAEGVVFPLVWDPAAVGPPAEQFIERFAKRFGRQPDYTAACTYDAMNMLIAAVVKAGLNRALIRDAIRELSPWPGVSGTITWDPTGQNARPVRLGTIRNGRIVPEGR